MTKLTLKQRKFWKCYQKTHSLIEAAKAAGSKGKDSHSLSVIGHQILRSLDLSMPELLDAQGLTDEAMAKPLQEGLAAERPIIATWEGKISDRIDISDHPTRAKFLEIYHRLKGNFIDRHELTGRDGGDIILQINSSKNKRETKSVDLDLD